MLYREPIYPIGAVLLVIVVVILIIVLVNNAGGGGGVHVPVGGTPHP